MDKKVARIDIVKAVAGVSFATLAAIGGATGNPLVAGLSAIPAASVASYEIVGAQLGKLQTRKEKTLEIPQPAWWVQDGRSWQNLCAEVEQCLPQIFQKMQQRMQKETRTLTGEVVQQIFIESLATQDLTWEYDRERKRQVAACIAEPILQKLSTVLHPIVEQIQQEGALLDKRRTAVNTEQTVQMLEKIHKGISNAGKRSPLSKEEVAGLHKSYNEALLERWRMLDFKGVMHVDMNHPISIPLVEVFIPPDVLIGVPEYETLEREGEQLFYSTHSQRGPRRIAPQREALHIALAQQRRLVLLGDPGSGKSTLLRYLLLQLVQGSDNFVRIFPQMADVATCVPLYIPLSAYAEYLLTNASGKRSLEDFLPGYLRDYYLGDYVDFIQYQLRRNNLFILFDGLDEIPDATLRTKVVSHIEMFTQTHAKCRFIVTSRIVGYKEAQLSHNYRVYTLADFNDEQVKTFARQWCPAYERWVNGQCDSQYLADAATSEAEKLYSATQSKPAVKRLAVNPLLLTILALIQRQGIDLPSHRVELFDLCAMTLIDTWVRAKGQSVQFTKSALIKILRPLAFWMHEHPAVGAIPEEELHEQVVHQLTRRGIREDEATRQAEQFLQTVRGKTGILIERGKERYGFLHLTFEEYFAACELEKRKDRDAFIQKNLHNPRWREVILLTVGVIGILQCDEEEVTELVGETIAQAGSPYEWALHRDLFLAGQCLADDAGVTVSCENDIIEQIVSAYLTSPHDDLRTACSKVLETWSDTRMAEKASNLAFPLLSQWVTSTKEQPLVPVSPFEEKLAQYIDHHALQYQEALDNYVRFDITMLLACLHALKGVDWRTNILAILSEESVRAKVRDTFAQSNDEPLAIIDALLAALEDPDEIVRKKVVIALGHLRDTRPEVIDALLIAATDSNLVVRLVAVNALGRLGDTQPRVMDALFIALLDHNFIKIAAIETLGLLGEGQPHVINTLLAALIDIDKSDIRKAAAYALARVGKGYPGVIDALLIALADIDRDVREAAGHALGQMDISGSDHIIDNLLSVVSNAQIDTVEAAEITANTLGQIGSDPSVIADKLRLSLSSADRARGVAVRVLGCLGKKEPRIREAIFAILSNTDDEAHHIGVATINPLEQWGDGRTQVIDVFLHMRSDTSWRVRRAIVKALAQLNTGQSERLDVLLKALSDVQQVKMEAITTIGKLSNGEAFVVEALLPILADYDISLREEAFDALSQITSRYPHIASELLIRLSCHNLTQQATNEYKKRMFGKLAGRAATLLGSVNNNQSYVIDMLFTVLADTNFSVSRDAANALAKLGKKQPSVLDRLVMALSDDNEQVQQRAVEAFDSMSEVSSTVIDALLSIVPPINTYARRALIRAVGRIGKGNPQVFDALLQALADPDANVRKEAAMSLRQVAKGGERPEVINALLQALTDPTASVRRWAATAIGVFDNGQPRVIKAIFIVFYGSSWQSRQGAANALGRLYKEQPQIIDTLLRELSNSDMSIKVATIMALYSVIDSKAEPHIRNALLAMFSDANYLLKERVIGAFGRFDRIRLPDSINVLLSGLSDRSSYVRRDAAIVFGNSDEEFAVDTRIITMLRQCLTASSWNVREWAARALSIVGAESDGVHVEQLLRQYEPFMLRETRGYSQLFSALDKIAEKMSMPQRKGKKG